MLYTSADSPNASPMAASASSSASGPVVRLQRPGADLRRGRHGVNLDDLGGGDSSDTLWFTRETDFSDGEVTRNDAKLAVNVGYGDDTRIGFMITRGNPATGTPSEPQTGNMVCTSDANPKNGGATWSPDGNAAAYELSADMEIVRFNAIAPGNCSSPAPPC